MTLLECSLFRHPTTWIERASGSLSCPEKTWTGVVKEGVGPPFLSREDQVSASNGDTSGREPDRKGEWSV